MSMLPDLSTTKTMPTFPRSAPPGTFMITGSASASGVSP